MVSAYSGVGIPNISKIHRNIIQKRRISKFSDLVELCAEWSDTPVHRIKQNKRDASIVFLRRIIIGYWTEDSTDICPIYRYFGHHHSTTIYNRRIHLDYMDVDFEYREKFNSFKKFIDDKTSQN